ncbi:hypothetical protein GS429_03775 [Natronorubrum sp. JWXQ-INN-674]|uniref:Uncharacterized protein n=1 Tax=Natronorubrum halalkaliphilum TaxID=2691917 RepID=A0A6B0VK81_9EURY|nr:hypothetical protein [Natronorubrum halalkaliphilum]MXV61192.1 hypothetical protein [Natronorubrum halalkaliphilum]
MKYCHNCDWFVGRENTTEGERSKAALEHFVETGHSIDSSDSVGRPMPPAICEAFLAHDLVGSIERPV